MTFGKSSRSSNKLPVLIRKSYIWVQSPIGIICPFHILVMLKTIMCWAKRHSFILIKLCDLTLMIIRNYALFLFVTFPMKNNCSTDITIFRSSLNWECYLWRSKDRTLYRNFITKVLLEQILLKQCHSDQNKYRFRPLCKIILLLLYLLRRPLSCN